MDNLNEKVEELKTNNAEPSSDKIFVFPKTGKYEELLARFEAHCNFIKSIVNKEG